MGLYAANMRANAEKMADLVDAETEAGRPVRAVVLDLSRQPTLTLSVLKGLQDLNVELEARGATLYLARVAPAELTHARHVGWVSTWVQRGRITDTVSEAVTTADAHKLSSSTVGDDPGDPPGDAGSHEREDA